MNNRPVLEQARALWVELRVLSLKSARVARRHWCRSLVALLLIPAVCAWLCCYTVRELPDPELFSSRVLAFSVLAITCLLLWFVGLGIVHRDEWQHTPRA